MTADDVRLIDTLIAAGIGTIILVAILGVVFAAVLLLRRAPSAQADAFTIASGLLKTTSELSIELREDGKRREAAASAHVAAINATTEALKAIASQQIKDSAALTSITTAVTAQADIRHREIMRAFDINGGFYPAVIEEIRTVKTSFNDLSKRLRRKRGNTAPIRGALQRIEEQLKRLNNEAKPYQNTTPAGAFSDDWREYFVRQLRTNSPQPNGASNGNRTGWDTNDA